jgi:hypothetical protein
VNDNLSNIYLAGSLSSLSTFYSPFLKTFLLVYFNGKVDSTFYIRYLDLETLVYLAKLMVQGWEILQRPSGRGRRGSVPLCVVS